MNSSMLRRQFIRLRSIHGRMISSHSLTPRAVMQDQHRFFIEEVAVSASPSLLKPLLQVIEASGGQSLPPSDREGLHPLLIPLAQMGQNSEDVMCLLRWPKPQSHKGMELPVVKMQRGGRSVSLIARTVDEYLHKILAEEDVKSSDGRRPLAEAAGAEVSTLYKQGEAAAAAKLELYLIKRVGMFPDISESLAMGHLKRGDTTSALVASEWYMRNNHFPGWARPYEFAAELFVKIGKRDEEARDMARVALRLPWWTLTHGFEAMRSVALLSGSPEEVRYNLSEEAAAAQHAKMNQGVKLSPSEPKTPQMMSVEKANELMDMVAAGSESSYDAVRDKISKYYREGGLNDIANFIDAKI